MRNNNFVILFPYVPDSCIEVDIEGITLIHCVSVYVCTRYVYRCVYVCWYVHLVMHATIIV